MGLTLEQLTGEGTFYLIHRPHRRTLIGNLMLSDWSLRTYGGRCEIPIAACLSPHTGYVIRAAWPRFVCFVWLRYLGKASPIHLQSSRPRTLCEVLRCLLCQPPLASSRHIWKTSKSRTSGPAALCSAIRARNVWLTCITREDSS